MAQVIFGSGKSYKTDYVTSTSINNRLFIRLLETSMTEAMQIATNDEAMKQITYLKYTFLDCKLVAVTNDRGVPKLSLSYTSMAKEP